MTRSSPRSKGVTHQHSLVVFPVRFILVESSPSLPPSPQLWNSARTLSLSPSLLFQLIIGYEAGIVVLWDLKCKKADSRYTYDEVFTHNSLLGLHPLICGSFVKIQKGIKYA